jgi:23S rRNA (adenine2030-N6)-methyltransferase
MNYRHDYHAGNFADVFKHLFLTRIFLHLAGKPAPLRYIETHSGAGIYDLGGLEAGKTLEWRDGIGRFATAKFAAEVQELTEPYLEIVRPLLAAGSPRYPGSPKIAQALLRPQDRMIFCELQEEARQRLAAQYSGDARAKVIGIDGYMGLKAFVPPVERRGVVLIDPPFEAKDEFTRLAEAIRMATRKWATGVYVIWYPVKDRQNVAEFAKSFVEHKIKRVLRLEIDVDLPRRDGPLVRTGLMIVNPPYRLEGEASLLLPALGRCLGQGRCGHLVEQLVGE